MKAFGLMVISVVASLAVSVPAGHAGDGEALFGPKYRSVSVEKNGEPRELVDGTRLQVKFAHEDGGDVVRWSSGCNLFGAQIEVSEAAIDTGEITSTDMACQNALGRQDNFFARFFAGDPSYSAEGRRLTLSTDRVEIELRRRLRG